MKTTTFRTLAMAVIAIILISCSADDGVMSKKKGVYTINTTSLSQEVKGFNGPTPLFITLDAEGRIKDVGLLENQETPRFAQRVVEGGLYNSWDGLTPSEALKKEVDAVSGATYTSTGVKLSLVARLKAYERQLKK